MLKTQVKRVAAAAAGLYARANATLLRALARRGWGSQEFIRRGVLPVALHYYQPIFDPETIPQEVWQFPRDMPGIEWGEEAQLQLLDQLASFAPECEWPAEGPGYHTRNGSWGYNSAALLHSMIRLVRPARVVEIGAGFSSWVIRGALDLNGEGELVSIDPNPQEAVKMLPSDRLIAAEVQAVPDLELSRGDLLFIDSSHVVRTGGDVNHLYLDVLPRLGSGVVVHVDDIQLPYEYPQVYSAGASGPRYFWTEQYLLQAFLIHNPNWEVMLAGHWLQRDRPNEFEARFPRSAEHRLNASFYMRRV